jgi:hypothetical protein
MQQSRQQSEHRPSDQCICHDSRPCGTTAADRCLDAYLTSIGETASERLEHVMSQHLADKEIQKLPYLERVRELQKRQ